MKVETKYFLCGVTCFPGGKNCNNYCNHDHNKKMEDSPATYEELVMEEIDMWKDVIEIISECTTGRELEILQSKYNIKLNKS